MSVLTLDLKLDPRRTAIVVIDLQKGIIRMPGTPIPTPVVIANSARLLTEGRRVGAQPVLVHVGGSADGTDRLHTASDQPMRTTAPPWADNHDPMWHCHRIRS